MIDFLVKYWRLILEVILLIISVVVLVLKKKSINPIFQDIYEFALYAVNEVEKSPLKGAAKLDLAVSFVTESLQDKYPGLNVDCYIHFIEYAIELILSTPQKKGD